MSEPQRPVPPRRRGAAPYPGSSHGGEPRVRRGVLRIPDDAASRLRGGHPFVFRDTLAGRPVRESAGEVMDLIDQDGNFIARGTYDPEGPIAVRVFTRDPDEALDSTALLRRVTAARRLREAHLRVPGSTELTAYRVLHGEGDFLPGITVDRYADYLVVHVYSAALEPHLDLLYAALEEVWQPRGIYLQRRFRPQSGEGPREPAELVRGALSPVELEVQEGALRFAVDVTAPLGTGLFLDLRQGRQQVSAYARDRRVLNLFSYTGAISLAAALGGAREVVSVDLSAKAHARARRNLQLSGLSEGGHEFVTGDALSVMARMEERRQRYDLVIIDPPSFSQARGQTLSVQRDYEDLVSAALILCAPGALLCCASNSLRFSMTELHEAVGFGASQAQRHVRVVSTAGLPPDFPVPAGFPDGHYLKFLTCAVI